MQYSYCLRRGVGECTMGLLFLIITLEAKTSWESPRGIEVGGVWGQSTGRHRTVRVLVVLPYVTYVL